MSHTCHHPECEQEVPPKMMACITHWYQLPKDLRDQVWAKYRPGQEIDKKPSKDYMEVFRKCITFWKEADRSLDSGEQMRRPRGRKSEMAKEKTPVNYLKDGTVGEFVFSRCELKTEEKTGLDAAGKATTHTAQHILFKLVLDKASVTKDAYATEYDPTGDVVLWGTTVMQSEVGPKGLRDFIPYSVFYRAFAHAAQKGMSEGKDSLPVGTCFASVRLRPDYQGNAKNFIDILGGPEVRGMAQEIAKKSAGFMDSILKSPPKTGGTADHTSVASQILAKTDEVK